MLDAKVAVLPKLLSPQVTQNIMEQCILIKLKRTMKGKQGTELPIVGARCVNGLLFSKLAEEDRTACNSEHGSFHADFRKTVLLSTPSAL